MPKAKPGCQVAFRCLLCVPVGSLKPPRADAVAPVCRLPAVAQVSPA